MSLLPATLKKTVFANVSSVKGQKRSVRKGLRYLRVGGADPYHEVLQRIVQNIARGRFSLESVSTSKDELERFRVENHKTLARIYLLKIRRGESSDLFGFYLKDEVRKGGFSLAEINTNREELFVLCPHATF